ncbi:hypothetical protein GF354_01585, partial [Candidatus Peregrinibacteria bacterium]|nr:hypothetical protein [Candidatus Peregrinibacteria bacterium]
YKADIEDMRESPSLKIKKILEDKGANVISYDPFIPENSNYQTLAQTLKEADSIIIATPHTEFKNISAKTLKTYNIQIVIDGKNCLNKADILAQGIIYKGIGH